MRLGPDATRYMLAGRGVPVARPFHLRVLAPLVCKDKPRRWLVMWVACWPTLATLMFLWGMEHHLGAVRSLVGTLLLCSLPGVLGPAVVRPVGVDLPSMVLALGAVVLAHEAHSWPVWCIVGVLSLLAGLTKESAPVWAALWAWNPLLLVGLVGPALVAAFTREEIDPATAQPELKAVHDHPLKTSMAAHADQWRDFWIMAAPWGACLAALYHPSISLLVLLAVSYGQLVVATDTTRLVHSAAGPAMALAAATVIPFAWLPIAVVLHLFFIRKPSYI